MTLSEWLRQTKTTQTAFAVRVGVSGVQVSRLCTGKNRPSLDLARRIEEETGGAVGLSDWFAEEVAAEGTGEAA